MTYEQIITLFEAIVGDTLDPTLEGQLLNDAKTQLEEEREWDYLKKLDETQVVNAGDTYQTMKTLPTDFARPLSRGVFVGTDMIPYDVIPKEDIIRWQSIAHKYYLDMANNQYAFMGNPQGGTVHFNYLRTTPTLTTGTSPVFPSRFHQILAYKMAIMFFAIDQGDKSRSWDDRWQIFYTQIHDAMVRWDAKLQGETYQNRALDSGVDLSKYPNIIDQMN